MTVLTVTTTTTIGSNEIYDGVDIRDWEHRYPSLFNYGAISYVGTLDWTLIFTIGGNFSGAVVQNYGQMMLNTTGSASGLYSGSHGPIFENFNHLEIYGASIAHGVRTYETGHRDYRPFLNAGTWIVGSNGSAIGIKFENSGATFENSGTMTVRSGWTGERALAAVGIFSDGRIHVDNTGTIEVFDNSNAAISAAVYAYGGAVALTNRGVIRAEYIVFWEYSQPDGQSGFGRFHNTGLMQGALQLGGQPDAFFNAGRFEGAASLAGGNDIWIGHNGVQTGRIDGGMGDDILIGGAGEEEFVGGAGRDVFGAIGSGGADQIIDFNPAEDGFDLDGRQFISVSEGQGVTRLTYQGGAFILQGVTGFTLQQWNNLISDQVTVLSIENDSHIGGGEIDRIFGDDGADRLFGGAGDDRLFGGDGDDILSGGVGDDYVDGGAGFDIVDFSDSAANEIDYTQGIEGIIGSPRNDNWFAFEWDGVVWAGAGNDGVDGLGGNDTLYGETGDDRLHGNTGDDLMYGGADADWIAGGYGNDRGFGGEGNDEVIGGPGDDWLDGNTGDDVLVGGDGTDTFVFSGGGKARDVIEDFEPGVDRLEIPGEYSIHAVNGGAEIRWSGGIIFVKGANVTDLPASPVICWFGESEQTAPAKIDADIALEALFDVASRPSEPLEWSAIG